MIILTVCTTEIWKEFSQPLKGFISRRISSQQDAEDILQEVFLKIHNNIENLTEERKVSAWIYKITRNTIIDYYRRHDKIIDSSALLEELVIESDEGLSLNDEITSCLRGMVDSLPQNYKQAVLLTEFEDLTQKEYSEKMGLSISGGKSRVQRARKILKELLLDCCHLEFDSYGNIVDYKHKSNDCKYCEKRT